MSFFLRSTGLFEPVAVFLWYFNSFLPVDIYGKAIKMDNKNIIHSTTYNYPLGKGAGLK